MRKKKEFLQTREQKLASLLTEMNADSRPDDGSPICETECTMARIRAFSDFLYRMKMKPWQTLCYYAAGFTLLLDVSAVWTREWLLTAVFTALLLIFATLPHNLRIWYFNKNADSLENSYGKIFNAEFADEKIVLRVLPPRDPDRKAPREAEATSEIPYESVLYAAECAHSFYIFIERSETVICDKTQFLRGTPMGLRDFLARKIGKKLKIKNKIK